MLGLDPDGIALTCAGRTDAGVHALGQLVHLDVPLAALARQGTPGTAPGGAGLLPRLARALTARLGPEVSVWLAALVPAGFDARRSAISRRYRYDVGTAPAPDPLRAAVSWQLGEPLELAPMRLAAEALIGEHDFAAFCRRPPPGEVEASLRRRVIDAGWRVLEGGDLDGETYRFEIEANAFCQQMVRSLVGLLVAVGRGRARPSEVVEHLASGERGGLPAVAPARGLCLVEVGYPGELGRTLRRPTRPGQQPAAPPAGRRAGAVARPAGAP